MYEYDVFISYKSGEINEEWLHDIFLKLFEPKLLEAFANERMGRPKIFIDKEDINPGADWRTVLKDKLSKTKCLIAIWTPTYFFDSIWCLNEYPAMNHRLMQLERQAIIQANGGIIVPVLKQSIEGLPSFASRLNYLDYTKFNRVGKGFKDSQDYDALQQTIEKDTKRIAKQIKQVPSWHNDFDNRPPIFRENGRSPITLTIRKVIECCEMRFGTIKTKKNMRTRFKC